MKNIIESIKWLTMLLLLFITGNPLAATVQPQSGALLQYTAGGHVLGFGLGKVLVGTGDHFLRVELVGARQIMPKTSAGSEAGNKPGTRAQPMQEVTYPEAWPGVSVKYASVKGAIAKSTYFIKAGLSRDALNHIRLRYNRPVRVDESGNLVICFEQGEMREAAPVAWQEQSGVKHAVAARYKIVGEQEVGFVAQYDPHYTLVIDPTLSWNTFLGGSGDDYCCSLAIDGSGNMYVSGYSSATWGSPVRGYSGNTDCFVAKLDNSGNLVWNTFLGGSGRDIGSSIVLDGNGNLYAGGESEATWGSPVRAFSGVSSIFAAKLNNNGGLVWNTFLGGSGTSWNGFITVNSNGVYVGGWSSATWGLPVLVFSGSCNVFAAKLDSNGTLVWNSFLGSSVGNNYLGSIVVDSNSNVYLAGESDATWRVPVRAYSGGFDAFVAKLHNDGTFAWNTFLGSTGYDAAGSMVLDHSGNIYVGGRSNTTWGSPLRAYNGGDEAFVTKLDNNGILQWNTFLGSSSNEYNSSLQVDSSGDIYVGGISSATWGSPYHAYNGGPDDAFVAKLNNGGYLQWNTFLGSSGTDYCLSMIMGNNGNIYVGGYSDTAWGSSVRAYSGGFDGFVAELVPAPVISNTAPDHGLASAFFKISLQGKDLLESSAIKLQNSQSGQAILGAALDVSANSLSAQFNVGSTPGLFDIVLTKPGVDFIFKTLFTLTTPQASPIQWHMAQLAKVCNTCGYGSLVIADANRDNAAEIYVAGGGTNFACLKKINSAWTVSNYMDTSGESFQQLLVTDGLADGQLELYAAGATPELYQYVFGNPTPSSTLGPDGAPLAAGDGNHDGVLKIYAASGNTTTGQGLDQWSYNNNAWSSSQIKAIAAGMICTSLVVGDAGYDPALGAEVYAAWVNGSNNAYLYQYQFNGSSWTSTGITNPGSGAIKGLVAADLNHNGQKKLYIANVDGKIYQLTYANPGWTSVTINPSQSVVCNQITVGDGDNDGQDELYGAGQDGHVWQYRLNGGAWQTTDLGYAGTTLNAIAIGDGDNQFQFKVYTLGNDGYVYQFKATSATPTPTPTSAAIITPQNYFEIFHSQINPLRGEQTRIKWTQPQNGPVTIRIFNLLGDKVITLINHENYSAGQYHEVEWQGKTQQGKTAGSGIYLVLLESPGYTARGKVAVIK